MKGGIRDVGSWAHEVQQASPGDALEEGATPPRTDAQVTRWRRKKIEGMKNSSRNSRPINMFRCQLSKARKVLVDGLDTESSGSSAQRSLNVSLQAYWLARNDWERRGIWFEAWGGLPGNTWAHEIPIEDWYKDNGHVVQTVPRVRRANRRKVEIGAMGRYRRRAKKSRCRVQWAEYFDGLSVEVLGRKTTLGRNNRQIIVLDGNSKY
ncbi:hypothetical protein BKA67DRAFT_110118 [Truncatella angustata]|uniref:Uncharacterized protein n=1 Tax=Truncatella angustata TaxID=152316 RepID=A0A9P8RG94_9PEZI|nr:uncharacterized protein BKA67DRAFT_110118 [Truncatella angustata]KAH6645297.1 hypothetical protein BKA67DRAFT_110118 [Truncatella angustata]